jgi:hypothetical protein
LYIRLDEKLGEDEGGDCIGSVTTPETHIENYAQDYYYVDPPDLSPKLANRYIFAKDYTFTYFDPLIHQFFNKIRIGDDLEELLIKSLFLFKHSYQEEEMREVLHPDLPVLPYKLSIASAYQGHPLFTNEWTPIELDTFQPTSKEFDLILRLAINFDNGIVKYAHITITTPQKLKDRYEQYFNHPDTSNAVYGYGHIIVQEYDLDEIFKHICYPQDHIKGNSAEEVLIRLACVFDIENLDDYLYEPLVKSEQTYTLRNQSVAYYEYHQSNDA